MPLAVFYPETFCCFHSRKMLQTSDIKPTNFCAFLPNMYSSFQLLHQALASINRASVGTGRNSHRYENLLFLRFAFSISSDGMYLYAEEMWVYSQH
jgi:hypothetical protein